MIELIKFDDTEFKLWPVPNNENYGLRFHPAANQLVKELKCFDMAGSVRKVADVRDRFYHGVNIVRMLWDNKNIAIHKELKNKKTVFNTYFLNAFKALCNGEDWILTGPASSAKTFTVSVYFLVRFFSNPTNTTCLITTTSGTSSERRTWGQIKQLHNSAKFEEWFPNEDGRRSSIGSVIDYLRCITFNPTKEILNEKSQGRDLRNGLIVVPVANDSTGENALGTIIGTKNTNILWAIDEMPEMMDGIMQPRANLEMNERFQFIGIGNANRKSDPHGSAAEPINGWDSINKDRDRLWKAKTANVLFLHGEESPNDHPFVQSTEILEKSDYPFPYLSNKIARDKIANDVGDGSVEEGKKTLLYSRFCIGFWYGDDVSNTILSEAFVKKHNANAEPLPWGPYDVVVKAALDPAFTIDGDANSLFIARCGRDIHGKQQIIFPTEAIEINPIADNDEDYRRAVAAEVVKQLEKAGCSPKDFGMDINGDGGLMYAAILEAWKKQSVIPISSMGSSSDERYDNKVTEYWFSIPNLIKAGVVKGFNTRSMYARDLFSRHFYNKGKTKVAVETKKEMKKRIKRSPDHGDSACYCAHLINMSGLVKVQLTETEKRGQQFWDNHYSAKEKKESSLFAEPKFDYASV